MPTETIEAPPKQEIGTNLGDVLAKATGNEFPNVLAPLEPVETTEKPPTPEPEKLKTAAEEVPKETKETKKSLLPPDDLFDAAVKPKETPETAKEEPKKLSPEDYAALYEKMGIRGEKARENFEKLASEAHAREQKVADLEKEVAKERSLREAGDPNAQARIQALEKQLSEWSPLVERANLKMHPAFVAQFEKPRAERLEIAKGIVAQYEIDPTQLEKALTLSGRAKADALDSIYESIPSPSQKAELEQMLGQIKVIDVESEKALANAKENNERLQEQSRIQQHQNLEQHTKSVEQQLGIAERLLREDGKLEVLMDSSDPEWSKIKGEVLAKAKRLMLETTDTTELAAGSILAGACGVYRGIVHNQRDRIKELETELSEYRSSEPGLGGGKPKEVKGEDEVVEDDFVKSVVRSLKRDQLV